MARAPKSKTVVVRLTRAELFQIRSALTGYAEDRTEDDEGQDDLDSACKKIDAAFPKFN